MIEEGYSLHVSHKLLRTGSRDLQGGKGLTVSSDSTFGPSSTMPVTQEVHLLQGEKRERQRQISQR